MVNILTEPLLSLESAFADCTDDYRLGVGNLMIAKARKMLQDSSQVVGGLEVKVIDIIQVRECKSEMVNFTRISARAWMLPSSPIV